MSKSEKQGLIKIRFVMATWIIKKMKTTTLFCLLIFGAYMALKAQNELNAEWEVMHRSKEQRLHEFNEAKFGMFIHWGVYSLPAGIWKGEKIKGLGEWIMYHAQIPRKEYLELCSKFNPVLFNAEDWVMAAKTAGMRYIVAMPKHHDGFAMYNSKVTDYDIIDATPFNRDPMSELYEACQKHGIRFGIYYSHSIDWMDGGDAGLAQKLKEDPAHTDNYGANLWDPADVSYQEYIENKAKPQVEELLTMFPDLLEIWYDFPRFMNKEQSFDFYQLAYKLQPSCLINSRVGNGLGDFWIPGDNAIPANEETGDIYWETPGTLNNTWGYKSYDNDWKSIGELLYWIVEITSKGGNYLLNVGPTGEGAFPKESLEQLKAIGEWMIINGEAVYGTSKWKISREGPTFKSITSTEDREENGFNIQFSPEDFWFSSKTNTVYATSLKWPDSKIVSIHSLAKSNENEATIVESVQLLGCKKPVVWEQKDESLQVTLPSCRPNMNGYVLKIGLKK